jgi:hypothetical protein
LTGQLGGATEGAISSSGRGDRRHLTADRSASPVERLFASTLKQCVLELEELEADEAGNIAREGLEPVEEANPSSG